MSSPSAFTRDLLPISPQAAKISIYANWTYPRGNINIRRTLPPLSTSKWWILRIIAIRQKHYVCYTTSFLPSDLSTSPLPLRTPLYSYSFIYTPISSHRIENSSFVTDFYRMDLRINGILFSSLSTALSTICFICPLCSRLQIQSPRNRLNSTVYSSIIQYILWVLLFSCMLFLYWSVHQQTSFILLLMNYSPKGFYAKISYLFLLFFFVVFLISLCCTTLLRISNTFWIKRFLIYQCPSVFEE